MTVDDRWVRKTNRWQVIFILLSFFVPVHSPFPARIRVPGMVCSRVESGTNDSGSRSLSLPPSLSLSHSVCLVSEWAYTVCWLAPPLPFSFCHWHLLPPFVPCFVLTVQKYSCRFHLFLPPLCHMFTCSYCLHNLRFFLFLSNDR